MRINQDQLKKFGREIPPAPEPIEPRLPPAIETEILTGKREADASTEARRARVLSLVRRPATPEGEDAELLLLLAEAGALPVDRREDHLSARQRLAAIGSMPQPSPGVSRFMDRLSIKAGDGAALADRLLPTKPDFEQMGRQGQLYST